MLQKASVERANYRAHQPPCPICKRRKQKRTCVHRISFEIALLESRVLIPKDVCLGELVVSSAKRVSCMELVKHAT